MLSTDIMELRKQLHSNPGVSGCESYAHDLIVRFLSDLHPTELNTHVGGYGVVAYWRACVPNAPTLAFRADIDALPIGHRCGHDGHTAIMLRFAQIVAQSEHVKNIVLVFQPEEETGKGAKKIIQSNLLQKYHVDAIFGLHNLPGYPEGTVVLNRGTFAAASCGVVYRFVGRATHASTPEKGLNPALAIASAIVRFDALNRITSDPKSFRQSTLVCCRVGEEAFGTSAGCGELMFTLRSFTNDAMHDLMSAADTIAIDESDKHQLKLEKQLKEPFKATENNAAFVDKIHDILSPHFPVELIDRPFRWSEDFAEYLTIMPGAFFGIGSGKDQPELHNPCYVFPDSVIEPAARCFELIMSA